MEGSTDPHKIRRIGLLCGTFNPPHHGHLHVAREVCARLSLDQVVFVPSGIPPHKEDGPIVSAAHRFEMTRLTLSNLPLFSLSRLEVDRSGTSYSIDTVRAFKALFPMNRFFFIIGVDAFTKIHTWKEADRLLTLCDFVVVSRPGHAFPVGRDVPQAPPALAIHFISIPLSAISASDIRARISDRQEVKHLLSPDVLQYITQHRLYL